MSDPKQNGGAPTKTAETDQTGRARLKWQSPTKTAHGEITTDKQNGSSGTGRKKNTDVTNGGKIEQNGIAPLTKQLLGIAAPGEITLVNKTTEKEWDESDTESGKNRVAPLAKQLLGNAAPGEITPVSKMTDTK